MFMVNSSEQLIPCIIFYQTMDSQVLLTRRRKQTRILQARQSFVDSSVATDREHPTKQPTSRKKIQRLVTLAVFLPLTSAFLDKQPASWLRYKCGIPHASLNLGLVPLSRFKSDITFFSDDETYRLCIDEKGKFSGGKDDEFELALVEEGDLPDLSRFVVAAFGADAIRLSQDMNAFERMLVSPAAELLNSYSTVVAFAEVFSGTKQRLKSRLQNINLSPPNVKGLSSKDAIEVAEKDSLVLALARPSQDGESRIRIIASIELRLQVRVTNYKSVLCSCNIDPIHNYSSPATPKYRSAYHG